MPLNAEAQAVLDKMASSGVPPLHTLSVDAARQLIIDLFPTKGEPEPVGKVEDRSIAGPAGPVPLRIYTPAGHGPFPILVYFHGGGWVIGNLETHDAPCRALANARVNSATPTAMKTSRLVAAQAGIFAVTTT